MAIKRSHTRPIKFTLGVNPYAQGSVIAEFGNTKIHITAYIDESLPPWLKGKGEGWVTAEYAMLPCATHDRNQRERKGISGRSQEIQRLIGRSLRSIIDVKKLGERQILIDCDVLVADGGTRTASISGAYLALTMAVKKLMADGKIKENPITNSCAALSVGINKDQEIIADLNYIEDSSCETDMNIVMTEDGKFIEIQGTAEGDPFPEAHLQDLLTCAKIAMKNVFDAQKKALAEWK